MSTVATSIGKVRKVLVDESDTNYLDAELYQYYNDAIGYLSRELAKWNSRIGIDTTTLSYSEHAYSAALPSTFLAMATTEGGLPRVFNASNSYERLTLVEPDAMDDWESEDNDDDGTVSEFIIDGLNMIVHPRADAATTIKIYYHPLESITDDTSTMPWGDFFNEPIEQFVIRQCRMRSELFQYAGPDVSDYERLKSMAWDILIMRESNWLKIKPSTSVGWSK
jgi:hypothetical protein